MPKTRKKCYRNRRQQQTQLMSQLRNPTIIGPILEIFRFLYLWLFTIIETTSSLVSLSELLYYNDFSVLDGASYNYLKNLLSEVNDVVIPESQETRDKDEIYDILQDLLNSTDDNIMDIDQDNEESNAWWTTLELNRVRPIRLNWNRNCNYCGALLLTNERSTFCCNNGQYTMTSLPSLPQDLIMIYENQNFSHISRKLNAMFSFTAIGVDGHFVHFDRGVSALAIQGRTYHRILPGQTTNSPLRWILYDANERLEAATERNLEPETVDQINTILNQINPFMHQLRRLKDDAGENKALVLRCDTNGEEIAAIMCIDNTTVIEPRSVIIHYHTDAEPTFMNSLSAFYEPLQYPLLFPHGTTGWSSDHALTQIWFYRIRILQENRFSLAGRLTNEYLVDMYSRVEEARLNYLRNNQSDAINDETVRAEGAPRPSSVFTWTIVYWSYENSWEAVWHGSGKWTS